MSEPLPKAWKDTASKQMNVSVEYPLDRFYIGDACEGEWEVQIRRDDDGLYIHVQPPYGNHDWDATATVPYEAFAAMLYEWMKNRKGGKS